MILNNKPIFAVGHSTMPIKKFIEILKSHKVKLLADIRTIPKSRHNPQFNEQRLKNSLKRAKIKYLHLKELGGLRRARKDSINLAWKNLSFRGFADYMQTKEFQIGLKRLIKLSQNNIGAIMCAEGNPYRCHRSLVADALLVKKVPVFHIAGLSEGRKHVLTPFARVRGGKIIYPRARKN